MWTLTRFPAAWLVPVLLPVAFLTIYPVADALRARNVPFFFSTAHDRAQLPERFRDVPVCAKPFGVPSFRLALGSLASAA